MEFLLHFFLCLFVAITGSAATGLVAEPGVVGNDASTLDTPNVVPEVASTNSNFTTQKEKWDQVIWQHNGKALIETWVGRAAVNLGRVTGNRLYETMKSLLEDHCPNDDVNHSCDFGYAANSYIATTRITTFPHIANDATLQWQVHAKFDNGDIHAMLIELAARTMQSLTSTLENCYEVPGHDYHCNLGNFIYINLPALGSNRNYIRLDIRSDEKDVYGDFKCCHELNKVDEVTDSKKVEIGKLFGKEYSRDAKCLIRFQWTCGECGAKCNACGWKCPKV